MLLADENTRGTFLIRNSEHNPNGFSLSVKDWDENRGYHVKHYKIKPLDNGGYYIATNQTFATLPALVLAYTSMFINLKPTPIRLHSKLNLKICIFLFFCFPPQRRECFGTLPCFVKTMSQTKTSNMGLVSSLERSMGD